MKTDARTIRQGLRREGFTLLELLCVMGIVAILFAATVPSIIGIFESSNINQAGQTFADQVNLARQIASSQNITVDVICLQLPAPNTPAAGYNGILLWSPNRGAPLSRLVRLPDGIAISQDTGTFSTLFASFPNPGGAQPPVTLPNGSTTYKYFTISPSGLVGPLSGANSDASPDMAGMSVTILPARVANATTLSAVKNYVLVQVNPITATTLVYRP